MIYHYETKAVLFPVIKIFPVSGIDTAKTMFQALMVPRIMTRRIPMLIVHMRKQDQQEPSLLYRPFRSRMASWLSPSSPGAASTPAPSPWYRSKSLSFCTACLS